MSLATRVMVSESSRIASDAPTRLVRGKARTDRAGSASEKSTRRSDFART
jgi:hypothetical protein